MSALERWYRRPRRVLLLFALVSTLLVTVALGVPLGYTPRVLDRTIGVQVDLEGAPETEIEREIVIPLENALARLSGAEAMSSVCDRGRGRVLLRFLADRDLEAAYGEVRAAVEAAAAGFPKRAQRPLILRNDPDSSPVFAAAFPIRAADCAGIRENDPAVGRPGAPEPAQSASPPSEAALKRIYGAVRGVGEIQIGGSAHHDVLVQFDPDKLATAGLNAQDLVQALRLNNVVGGFAEPGQAPRIVDGRFRSLDELRRLPVTRRLRLEEVARVSLSPSAARTIGRLNGAERMLVYIQAAGDANTVALCRELRRVTGSVSGGEILLDEGIRIEGALREIVYSVLTGIVLVVLLTILIERRLSAALAVSLGVPFAVAAAVGALRVGGRELDLMSLAGIAVGAGLAIDAGVVWVEEHLRLAGRTSRVLRSAGGPILFSAASTVVVFVPLLFAPRILKESLGGLALAVAAALIASTLYVFLVLPVLLQRCCALPGPRLVPGGPPGRRHQPFRRASRASRLLSGLFFGASRLRPLVALALAATLASAALVATGLPRAGFEADADRALRFSVEYPSGWSREAVFARTAGFEEFVCGLKGVRFVSARYERERAAFYVVPEGSGDLRAIADRIRERGAGLREGFLYLPPSAGGGVAAEVTLAGPSLGTLRSIARELAAETRRLPGVEQVVFRFKDALPARLVEVDLTAAAMSGVNPREVYRQLFWTLSTPVADKWTTGVEERDIRIGAWSRREKGVEGRLSGPPGSGPSGGEWMSLLDRLAAGGAAIPGTAVPLRALVRLSDQEESGRIYRSNRQRSLSFEVDFGGGEGERAPGRTAGRRELLASRAAWQRLQTLVRGYPFPPEYRAVVQIGDPAQARLDRSLVAGLLLAVFLIACVLLFQFESLRPTAIVLLQVPLSFVVPVLVLRAASLALSVPAMVGLLLTAGVAVNNAILVLDAAGLRSGRRAGHAPALTVTRLYHALRTRLRPMLLASLTTILGVVPLLFAGRADQGVLAPLSVTIAAGIAGSLGALLLSLAAVGRRPALLRAAEPRVPGDSSRA